MTIDNPINEEKEKKRKRRKKEKGNASEPAPRKKHIMTNSKKVTRTIQDKAAIATPSSHKVPATEIIEYNFN